jgi:hypothetical protein
VHFLEAAFVVEHADLLITIPKHLRNLLQGRTAVAVKVHAMMIGNGKTSSFADQFDALAGQFRIV